MSGSRRLKHVITEEDIRNHSINNVEGVLKHCLHLSRREISRAKFTQDGILFMKGGREENAVLSKSVRVNVKTPVVSGDILWVELEGDGKETESLVPSLGKIDVLYEDKDVAAVYKPPGIPVHPSKGHYSDSLANILTAYFAEHGEYHSIRAIGRLDQDVSGIMLYAKNRPAAARLSAQRMDGRLKKTYLAIVEWDEEERVPEHESAEWIEIDAPILKTIRDGRAYYQVSRNDGNSAPAVTRYRVLSCSNGYALVSVEIDTGRTHQIRIHMASIGHPLLGDGLYGKPFPGVRTMLHAGKLRFLQPFTEEPAFLKSPLPDDFREWYDRIWEREKMIMACAQSGISTSSPVFRYLRW